MNQTGPCMHARGARKMLSLPRAALLALVCAIVLSMASSVAPGAGLSVASATTASLLFSDQFTSFNTNVWWPGYPYHANATRGALDEGSKSSWNAAPAQSIAGEPIQPFSTISDPTASGGRALRITCRRTTAAQAATLRGLGASAVASRWAGGIAISKANFGYGYFEWRMRLTNPGAGMFPALWAFGSVTNHNNLAHDQAEMDMFEIFGKASGTPWNASVHLKNNLGIGPSYPIAARSDSTTGWHTYGIDWHANVLLFYRDGVLIGDASRYAYFFRGLRMQLRMNYTVGDGMSWMPHTTTYTPSRLTMDIDYVRQYNVKP
jgi:hypothetical protein